MPSVSQDSRRRRTADTGWSCQGITGPYEDERPVAYAERIGGCYAMRRTERQRKATGLFLTPAVVADFMARQVAAEGKVVRIIDPAAGAGILCCAVAEALVFRRPKPCAIELVAYEVDNDLIAPLRAVLDYLAGWCRGYGVTVAVRVEALDFVMANAGALRPCGLFPAQSEGRDFDVVIANPPYFKLGKHDPRATAVPEVVHGQPNIYALFMAVGAALLRQRGSFVYITPRSFASGPYFRRFRSVFFGMIRPTAVHLFGSRRDAFRRAAVLQENVIVSGIRQDGWQGNDAAASLAISTCFGVDDIERSRIREVSVNAVFASDDVLRLPICDDDDEALALVDSWPSNLGDLGWDISTGPVVPFRAPALVARKGEVPASHVPLLWMNHVRAMRTMWPLHRHKPEYIARAGAEKLLVPNRNYVLIRRFSAKEEPRRLTAAPYFADDLRVPALGLENHLNYVHRRGSGLSADEARGLAVLYNSRLLDTWFRAVNGNTQVSATELRSMPLPAHDTIVTLGRQAKRLAEPTVELDALVATC